jgi:excisionase family DNA binding protein
MDEETKPTPKTKQQEAVSTSVEEKMATPAKQNLKEIIAARAPRQAGLKLYATSVRFPKRVKLPDKKDVATKLLEWEAAGQGDFNRASPEYMGWGFLRTERRKEKPRLVEQEFFTIEEAAIMLGCTELTLRRSIREGRLRCWTYVGDTRRLIRLHVHDLLMMVIPHPKHIKSWQNLHQRRTLYISSLKQYERTQNAVREGKDAFVGGVRINRVVHSGSGKVVCEAPYLWPEAALEEMEEKADKELRDPNYRPPAYRPKGYHPRKTVKRTVTIEVDVDSEEIVSNG